MRRIGVFILTAGVLAALPIAAAADDKGARDRANPLRRPPFGSVARQLNLKLSLQRQAGGRSLVASVDHNRQEWKSLSPDQREQYRKQAVAFLKKNPHQQEKMLTNYEKLIKLDAERRAVYRRRAKWLKAVVRSFTDEEREELRRMDPDDRARKLIARRDKLAGEGKLKLESPSTKPAKQSAEK